MTAFTEEHKEALRHTTPNCITAVFFRLYQHEMRVRWLFPTVHGTQTGCGLTQGSPILFYQWP